MRIAVIGDVHGNKYALESVLQDIKTRDVDTLVCMGDLVGYMPFPHEVIENIRENHILVIKGNHDERIAGLDRVTDQTFKDVSYEDAQKSASALYINKLLSEADVEYLKTLPDQIKLEIGAYKVLFVHGSPNSISEYMYDDVELLNGIGQFANANVIVSGHTHLPYHTQSEGIHYLNPGSVGKPKHGNSNAMYMLMDVSDNVSAQFIEVSYDLEKMVEAIYKDPYIADGIAKNLVEGK